MKKLSLDTAEGLAKKLRSDAGLSLTEPINLKSLLRKLDVQILFRPLSRGFYGMSLRSPAGVKFMLINCNNSKGRQHFSIAHELYHLYFDHKPTPVATRRHPGPPHVQEANADMFAAALLMPETGLRNMISAAETLQKQVRLATIIKMEQYFSVSRTALLHRLKNLKIITEAERDDLQKLPVRETARQYGYSTALYRPGNAGLVISDFGEKAYELYERELISEGHYLELLHLINDETD